MSQSLNPQTLRALDALSGIEPKNSALHVPSCENEQEEIARLIAQLDSVLEGELALCLIVVEHGQRAVPYLAGYILDGRPRSAARAGRWQ
jgi:hypothetical protein